MENINISNELIHIMNNASTIKVISTLDRNGNPHVVFKDAVFMREDGMIVLIERLESSITNENLVKSIRFNNVIALNILSVEDKISFMIQGILERAIIYGKEFQKYYIQMKKIYGNIDISTIWLIRPLSIQEKTLQKRINEEKKDHPMLMHLDQIYRK